MIIKKEKFKFEKGISLLEAVFYIAILSIIISAVTAFVFALVTSEYTTQADREVGENARRAMEIMTYEIRSANSVYSPTTTQNQLSLQTFSYPPENEDSTYIDFFLCGTKICMKKESQDPVAITSESVEVDQLSFSSVLVNNMPSIKIDLTINCRNSSINLISTASLRSY